MIRPDMTIEDLVDSLPDSVPYLMGKGIQPIACGAPIWGTLEEAARGKGYDEAQIEEMVAELQEMEQQGEGVGSP